MLWTTFSSLFVIIFEWLLKWEFFKCDLVRATLTCGIDVGQFCKDSRRSITHENSNKNYIKHCHIRSQFENSQNCYFEISWEVLNDNSSTHDDTTHYAHREWGGECNIPNFCSNACWFFGRMHREPRQNPLIQSQRLHFFHELLPKT